MFNLKNHKEAQVSPTEKYLRQENVGPEADDGQAIWEKELPHREGDKETITEDQFGSKHKIADGDDAKVIEKVLEEAKGYVTHRSDQAETSVMPNAALVEKMRQNRVAEDYEVDKESHWSQTYNEKKQQGKLPRFPKNAPQHDKIVLNNDPRRFETAKNLPVHEHQPENDADRNKSNTIKPLTGGVTTADVDRVASNVKTGKSVDFDTAIVAILREADKESRELTPVEQKTISELKIARTKSMMQK